MYLCLSNPGLSSLLTSYIFDDYFTSLRVGSYCPGPGVYGFTPKYSPFPIVLVTENLGAAFIIPIF